MKTLNLQEVKLESGEDSLSIGNDLVLLDSIDFNDMERTPMQLGFLLLGFCRSGEAKFKMGGQELHIVKGDLLISLGGQVFDGTDSTPDFQASAVLMSQRFAEDCVVGLNYMWPYLLYVLNDPIIHLTSEEQRWLLDCYGLLRHRGTLENQCFLRETLVALTRAFYFEVCSLLDSRIKPTSTRANSRAYAIFDKFIRLVSQHYKDQRSVEWYSSQLCLTPKHLSEVVKAVSGRTAGQWITSLVIIEIKTLLQDSSLAIKEVAQEMNFPNQSFLGKYFKNVEGMSPSEFRRSRLG